MPSSQLGRTALHLQIYDLTAPSMVRPMLCQRFVEFQPQNDQAVNFSIPVMSMLLNDLSSLAKSFSLSLDSLSILAPKDGEKDHFTPGPGLSSSATDLDDFGTRIFSTNFHKTVRWKVWISYQLRTKELP